MTLDEIKSRVIFQANADEDDLDDYEPAITGYVNAGYDLILEALTNTHLDMGNAFVSLSVGTDVPKVFEWTHIGIADYATYLVYRNGNPQKQSRGQAYLAEFNDILEKCKQLRGKLTVDFEEGTMIKTSDMPKQFYNVYPPYVSTGFDPFK